MNVECLVWKQHLLHLLCIAVESTPGQLSKVHGAQRWKRLLQMPQRQTLALSRPPLFPCQWSCQPSTSSHWDLRSTHGVERLCTEKMAHGMQLNFSQQTLLPLCCLHFNDFNAAFLVRLHTVLDSECIEVFSSICLAARGLHDNIIRSGHSLLLHSKHRFHMLSCSSHAQPQVPWLKPSACIWHCNLVPECKSAELVPGLSGLQAVHKHRPDMLEGEGTSILPQTAHSISSVGRERLISSRCAAAASQDPLPLWK